MELASGELLANASSERARNSDFPLPLLLSLCRRSKTEYAPFYPHLVGSCPRASTRLKASDEVQPLCVLRSDPLEVLTSVSHLTRRVVWGLISFGWVAIFVSSLPNEPSHITFSPRLSTRRLLVFVLGLRYRRSNRLRLR